MPIEMTGSSRKSRHTKTEKESRTLGKIPPKKMLVGHAKKEDIYQTPNGKTYSYTGTEYHHWKNPKYWRRLT